MPPSNVMTECVRVFDVLLFTLRAFSMMPFVPAGTSTPVLILVKTGMPAYFPVAAFKIKFFSRRDFCSWFK